MSKHTQQQHQPPPPRLPSKDDLALLTHLSNLLHLLHHRNKNQHRRSPWYRHFSLFRRNLTALLSDYTLILSTPTTNLERARLKSQTPALQLRISQRLDFWQDVLVGKWQRAFSQVVADGRFSVIGLVMLACLGGVCRVVGVVEGLEVLGQEEVERVLEEFGREAWGSGGDGGFGEVVARGEDGGERVARVDEGEVVVRDVEDEVEDGAGEEGTPVVRYDQEISRVRDDESDDEPAAPKPPQRLSSSPPKVAKTKRTSTKKRVTTDTTDSKPKAAKKKRKKGGDAIDDLFSGW